MSKKLYYHKTSGGAEYLTDRWVKNPDGSKEGVFENASILVRIDGDITKDAEITLVGFNEMLALLERVIETSSEPMSKRLYHEINELLSRVDSE